jgi:hypothetical protein
VHHRFLQCQNRTIGQQQPACHGSEPYTSYNPHMTVAGQTILAAGGEEGAPPLASFMLAIGARHTARLLCLPQNRLQRTIALLTDATANTKRNYEL